MKIAFIRSVDVYQAHPTLSLIEEYCKKQNIEAKLFYTDGQCNANLFPGGYEKICSDISCEQLAKKVADWGADKVISISIPDDNSFRDSCVKKILEDSYGIPMIMHSLDATVAMCNKWDTAQLLRKLEIPVTDSFLLHGDLLNKRGINYKAYITYLQEKVEALGFPIIVKPLWDCMSLGISIYNDIKSFDEWIKTDPPIQDMLIEQYLINGELFSIEVLGQNGIYMCQPLIKKCTGKEIELFPFNHFRFGPYVANDLESQKKINVLKKNLIRVAEELQICGAVEFEIMRSEGEFIIIEINPRISGTTNLSSYISGNNSYVCLLEMALGNWSLKEYKEKFAAEFPLLQLSQELLNTLKKDKKFVFVNKVVYHDGREQTKAMLKADDIYDCQLIIKELHNQYKIISGLVMEELDACCEVL